MAGKFEITQSKSGKFMFNLKAGNGQIILTSQMYETKASAMNGVESCKKTARLTSVLSATPPRPTSPIST